MSNAAATGFGFVTGTAHGGPMTHDPRIQIGFVYPTIIYEKMRDIQRSAAALDADITANVADQIFKTSWTGWYENWRQFFDKYQSQIAKTEALLHTEELNRQVESYRLQLLGYFEAYRRQHRPDGAPVPPPTAEPPTRAPQEIDPTNLPGSGWSLPWWVWVIGGVAVAGAGYWLYRTYLGKPISIMKSAFHDPSPRYRGLDLSHDRDPGDVNIPRLPPARARDPYALAYRPYEHPHLVPQQRVPSYTHPAEMHYGPARHFAGDPYGRVNPHDPYDVYEGTLGWSRDEGEYMDERDYDEEF